MDDEVRKNWDRLRARGSADPYVIGAQSRLAAAVDLSERFPSLGQRPYVLEDAGFDELLQRLADAFEVVDIDATSARTGGVVRAEVSAALGLPAPAGDNWDGFLDGFADVVERAVTPLALVVRGLDTMARVDAREFLATFVELDRIVYQVSAYRPVIPRQVIAIFPGSWTNS